MNKENNEKIVNEIIEYANNEIRKSKRKHFLILLSALMGVIVFTVALLWSVAVLGENVMWIFFGITAVFAALLNLVWTFLQWDAKWFRFISMTLTAFTVCSFYADAARWVLSEDWDALRDVLPITADMLWILTIASVLLNSISLFVNRDR
jgi:uncharacterized membrane protein